MFNKKLTHTLAFDRGYTDYRSKFPVGLLSWWNMDNDSYDCLCPVTYTVGYLDGYREAVNREPLEVMEIKQ